MNLILTIVLNSIEVNYACKDQHIDATFNTYQEAVDYAEYFRHHHHYKIFPFFKFKDLEKKNG